MNFGLIVNLDLKRALFPRRLEKYRKLPVSTNPLKLFHSIWHYVKPNRLCPVTTIVCFTMSLIMLNFINFLFQCQYKFYLDFYLFFLLLKQSIQQGCFFLFLFVIQKDFNLLKWRSVFFFVRLFLVLLGKNLVHIRFD